jgi:hypothetical protein
MQNILLLFSQSARSHQFLPKILLHFLQYLFFNQSSTSSLLLPKNQIEIQLHSRHLELMNDLHAQISLQLSPLLFTDKMLENQFLVPLAQLISRHRITFRIFNIFSYLFRQRITLKRSMNLDVQFLILLDLLHQLSI